MTDWFRRLPQSQRAPAGLERVILRRLPGVMRWGSAVSLVPSVVVRIAALLGGEPDALWSWHRADFYSAGLLFVFWNLALVVAIGAFMVLVMKGPAYVADAYPLVEAQRPPGDPPAAR